MKQKKSKIYLRTLQALEQIGRTFTVDQLEHVICLKYAEKVDQKLAHSQAAALKSMVRTLFTICLFVWHACFFFFRRVCFLPRLESGDMVLPPEETGSQWHKVWNVSGRLS